MTIEIDFNGTVTASCKAKNTRSILDYGRNKINIRRFFFRLNKQLGLKGMKPVKAIEGRIKRSIKRLLGGKTGEPEDGELIER